MLYVWNGINNMKQKKAAFNVKDLSYILCCCCCFPSSWLFISIFFYLFNVSHSILIEFSFKLRCVVVLKCNKLQSFYKSCFYFYFNFILLFFFYIFLFSSKMRNCQVSTADRMRKQRKNSWNCFLLCAIKGLWC